MSSDRSIQPFFLLLYVANSRLTLCRPKHMRQLFEISKAPFKRWKPLPAGDHNSSVLEEGYFEAVADFVAEVTTEKPREQTRL